LLGKEQGQTTKRAAASILNTISLLRNSDVGLYSIPSFNVANDPPSQACLVRAASTGANGRNRDTKKNSREILIPSPSIRRQRIT
jgi:hypothetical protein